MTKLHPRLSSLACHGSFELGLVHLDLSLRYHPPELLDTQEFIVYNTSPSYTPSNNMQLRKAWSVRPLRARMTVASATTRTNVQIQSIREIPKCQIIIEARAHTRHMHTLTHSLTLFTRYTLTKSSHDITCKGKRRVRRQYDG